MSFLKTRILVAWEKKIGNVYFPTISFATPARLLAEEQRKRERTARKLGWRTLRKLERATAAASRARTKKARTREEQIAEAAALYRKAHPNHSARTLALSLARKLAIPVGTVRATLSRLKTR